MKKLLTTTMVLMALPVFAAIEEDDIAFYAGLSAGGLFNSAEISKLVQTTTTNKNGDLISEGALPYNGDMQHFSAAGQVQLGAGIRFDYIYLGLEVLGQFSNGDMGSVESQLDFIGTPNEIPTSFTDFNAQVSMNDFEPAIDFKPGVFLTQHTLLYGRLGAAFNEITLTDNSSYNLVNGGAVFDVNASESDNVVAFRAGLGVEHYLADQFTVFMDYTYTHYGDLSLQTYDTASALLGNPPDQFELIFDVDGQTQADTISKQAVMIGFNYYL